MESNTQINFEESKTSMKFSLGPAFIPERMRERGSNTKDDDKKIMDALEKLENHLFNDIKNKSKFSEKADKDLFNMLNDLQKTSNNEKKLKEYLKGLKQGDKEKLLNALVEGQLYSLKFK